MTFPFFHFSDLIDDGVARKRAADYVVKPSRFIVISGHWPASTDHLEKSLVIIILKYYKSKAVIIIRQLFAIKTAQNKQFQQLTETNEKNHHNGEEGRW